mmetsp:Transcript_34293/g.91627  ORF Transcript_34293/g.91627 Transcript_34293/m.91627 type:complete len:249 (-) Transcript_34293:66-812(-)
MTSCLSRCSGAKAFTAPSNLSSSTTTRLSRAVAERASRLLRISSSSHAATCVCFLRRSSSSSTRSSSFRRCFVLRRVCSSASSSRTDISRTRRSSSSIIPAFSGSVLKRSPAIPAILVLRSRSLCSARAQPSARTALRDSRVAMRPSRRASERSTSLSRSRSSLCAEATRFAKRSVSVSRRGCTMFCTHICMTASLQVGHAGATPDETVLYPREGTEFPSEWRRMSAVFCQRGVEKLRTGMPSNRCVT